MYTFSFLFLFEFFLSNFNELYVSYSELYSILKEFKLRIQ